MWFPAALLINDHRSSACRSPEEFVTPIVSIAWFQGKVMERILQEEEEAAAAARRRRRAVVYLGDGRGDYCPSLKLRESDYVMPRAGYPVCDLIAEAPPAAGVREWDGFEDLARVLLGIVDDEIATSAAKTKTTEHDDAAATNAVVVPDCRPLPVALLPQAVRVPN
jgi:pyridoxal phosphate phosphatase PHOSPHO2